MNLIEQLGGREAAKNLLGGVSNNKSPREILTRELLAYRRQHNIFEVGIRLKQKIISLVLMSYLELMIFLRMMTVSI